jgi:hypothetical protein
MTALPDPQVSSARRQAVSVRHPLSAHAATRRISSGHRRALRGRGDSPGVRRAAGQRGLIQAVAERARHVAELDAFAACDPGPADDNSYAAAVRLQRVRFGFGA